MHQVVMTGTAENAGGGITSVIRLIKKTPVWEKYNIFWLATQTNERSGFSKLWIAMKATIITPFVIRKCKIVHFHIVPGITLLTQLPELLFAKLYRKKIIMEIHVGNQLEPYAKDKFFKWWLKKADLVLLLAKRWEKLFKEEYFDVQVATDVLYNACDIHKHIMFEEKKKEILFAGTINKNKAPDLLLKAWAKIWNKYPDWHVTFMGSGNISYYKEMAQKFGIGDCVDFTGYITGYEREMHFHDSSIYCMCSYMEGFPMTVLEAWAHSTAVITTPVGGLPDVIEEEKNCLTFPMGNSEKLAEQIEKLICDEQLRRLLCQFGFQYAKDHFSLNVIGEKLNSIYLRVLENYE